MTDDVLAALDFPAPCNGCRHPADGHVGELLKCGECDCSRANPGGFRAAAGLGEKP